MSEICNPDNYMTTPQFAKEIGVHLVTVYKWEKAGRLKPHHITPTGRKFYSRQQVEEFFESRNQ